MRRSMTIPASMSSVCIRVGGLKRDLSTITWSHDKTETGAQRMTRDHRSTVMLSILTRKIPETAMQLLYLTFEGAQNCLGPYTITVYGKPSVSMPIILGSIKILHVHLASPRSVEIIPKKLHQDAPSKFHLFPVLKI